MDLFKNLFGIILMACVLFSSCTDGANESSIGTEIIQIPATLNDENAKAQAEITFEKTEVLTGKITQGDVLNFSFPFTNTGEGPLLLSSVMGSCGCTIPKSYPRDKIMPGEGGVIEVEFDSDNKWGYQTVTISVVANTIPSINQLIIRADIVVPDNMKTNK